MSLSVAQLAWTAGVLDMRGKIQVKQNMMRATRQMTLYVESGNLSVVRELGRLTGTVPEARKSAREVFHRRGCNEHCEDPHVEVLADVVPQAKWTVTGVALAVVVGSVEPYLREPLRFAEARDEVMEGLAVHGPGSGAIIKALTRLEELGWDVPPALNHLLPVKV